MQAYGRAPGQAPRPPPPARYSFIVTIGNPLIVVHGETATAQLVFTEYVIEKQGDPVKVTTQGKEYGTFVKVDGHGAAGRLERVGARRYSDARLLHAWSNAVRSERPTSNARIERRAAARALR